MSRTPNASLDWFNSENLERSVWQQQAEPSLVVKVDAGIPVSDFHRFNSNNARP